jgi:hypothetical protein
MERMARGITPHPNPPPQGGRGYKERAFAPPPPLRGRVGVGGDAMLDRGTVK